MLIYTENIDPFFKMGRTVAKLSENKDGIFCGRHWRFYFTVEVATNNTPQEVKMSTMRVFFLFFSLIMADSFQYSYCIIAWPSPWR